MSDIQRTALFGKLNRIAYQAVESATVFARLRGNPNVELVHWLHQLLQLADTDLHRIIRHLRLDAARISEQLVAGLERLPCGATEIADFSADIEETIMQAWLYATLRFDDHQVRTGHLLIGQLRTPRLRRVLTLISPELARVDVDELAKRFGEFAATSPEQTLAASDGSRLKSSSSGSSPDENGALPPAVFGQQEALRRFTTDLTERVRRGELDPIIGRDEEIRQCVDILMRRRQNNPILTGEAGVGKTAIVEGFAQRIVAGDVPPALRDVSVRVLDVGLLQAGASMKGEFEQRLRSVIDEVQAASQPIILFIDEVHTLVGAGGAAGTGDAANLLKPALARGTLRTIAATTWDEYKRHIEKDPALTRRFQVVKVEEPDEERCIRMMRAVMAPFERHHRVQILDEAIEAAVRLSHRYIPARQLPDKAVSLIDTACARVAVSQHAVPAVVDETRRRIRTLETEQAVLRRESVLGYEHEARISGVGLQLGSENETLAGLEQRWEEERSRVNRVLELRARVAERGRDLEEPPRHGCNVPLAPVDLLPNEHELRSDLKRSQEALREYQGESPLIFPWVDANAVAGVVADWTGVPVGRMLKDEVTQVLGLAESLEKRVIGQRQALEAIARRVQTSRAKLDNPNRPVGVFLLAGPSGTGKTETALALSETMFGGEQNLISINMSEFQEAHTVSTLKGSPPGYVGYGEGGVLTEAVRRRPYSVVLLDEVEKAHPDVHEIFFQVFDQGWMEDAEGRYIDFKNTIIILTTNAGQDVLTALCKDPELVPGAESLEKAMRGPLTKVFPDALLNRLVVVPYYPINAEILRRIIRLNLMRVVRRLKENHRVEFTYDESVPELVARRCTELERGARMVDSLITSSILPEIGRELLTRTANGVASARVHASTNNSGFTFAFA